MKQLLVLGAGTAGTMAVNKLRPHLPADDWAITVVDATPEHHYQPGYLFIPFGTYQPDEVVKQKANLLTDGVDLLMGEVDVVKPDDSVVVLTDGRELAYDQLIIATGTHPRRDQTEGLDGDQYGITVHDFYSLEGATRLAEVLDGWGVDASLSTSSRCRSSARSHRSNSCSSPMRSSPNAASAIVSS